MKKILVSVLACSAIALSGFWYQAPASDEGEKSSAEQLFESKCSLCHSINRPKSKQKTKAEWESTVMRMKNANGCPITDEEAKMIIDYLAEEYGE